MRDVNKLLAEDLREIHELPTFVEVSERCTRQMCRSGVIDMLAEQPGVAGLDIKAVASIMDDASSLIGELMLIVAKLYQEKGLPIEIVDRIEEMQIEEAAKFGVAKQEEDQEEEECQSSPPDQDKKLN
jgi:hypothetical protein